MEGSERFCADGCTLIGSERFSQDGGYYNDLVIVDGDNGVGKRHLIIKYSTDNRSYYIRDLGDGNGTFVKVDRALKVKHGYIISFGDSHMVIQIQNEQLESNDASMDG